MKILKQRVKTIEDLAPETKTIDIFFFLTTLLNNTQIEEALTFVRMEIEKIRKGDVSKEDLRQMYIDPLPSKFESLRPYLDVTVLTQNSSSSSSRKQNGTHSSSNALVVRLFQKFLSRDSSKIVKKYLITMSSRVNEASFRKVVKQHLTFENVSEDISNGKISTRQDLWKALALICNNVLVLDPSSKESDAAMDLMGWGRPYILDEEEKNEEEEKKKKKKKKKNENKKRKRDTSSSSDLSGSDSTQTSPSKPPPSKRAAATPQKTTTKRSSRRSRRASSATKSSTTTRSGPVRKSRRARKPKKSYD